MSCHAVTEKVIQKSEARLKLFPRRQKNTRQMPEESVSASVEKTSYGVDVHVGRRVFSIAGEQPGNDHREHVDFILYGIAALGLVYNLRIEIDAPVTENAYSQVNEFGRVWKTWLPSELYPLKLSAGNIVAEDGQQRSGGLVCASGGVDSTYTMLNARRDFGFTHSLLVNGTDFPEVTDEIFEELKERVKRISDLVELEPLTIKTDFKKLFHWRWWNYFHPNNLAMCLRYSGAGMAFGGYAADVPEASEFVAHPWGNNHIVARQMSSDDFPVHYMGTDTGRSGKVKTILAEKPSLMEHLSFCFQESARPLNCGKCEKCIRTRLNLATAGETLPHLFRETPDLAEILRQFKIPKDDYLRGCEVRRMYDAYYAMPEGPLRDEVANVLVRLARPLGGP